MTKAIRMSLLVGIKFLTEFTFFRNYQLLNLLLEYFIPVNECTGDEEDAAVLVLMADVLPAPEPPAAAQTKSLLSLPPDANHWLSGDHFRPHTS